MRYASARSSASLRWVAIPIAANFSCSRLDRSCTPNLAPLSFIEAFAALIRSEIIFRSCSAQDA
jgi:hypothetical protein